MDKYVALASGSSADTAVHWRGEGRKAEDWVQLRR
jgi:hypothetical protein